MLIPGGPDEALRPDPLRPAVTYTPISEEAQSKNLLPFGPGRDHYKFTNCEFSASPGRFIWENKTGQRLVFIVREGLWRLGDGPGIEIPHQVYSFEPGSIFGPNPTDKMLYLWVKEAELMPCVSEATWGIGPP